MLPRGASARASGPPAPYVSDVTTTRRICICADRAKTSRLAAPKYPDLGSEFAACHWAILRLVFLSYTPVAGSPNASWSIPTSVPASPRPMSRIGSHIVVTTSPAADARLESSAYLAGESGSRWELTSSRGRSGRRPSLGRSYGSPLRGDTPLLALTTTYGRRLDVPRWRSEPRSAAGVATREASELICIASVQAGCAHCAVAWSAETRPPAEPAGD
mmetsp:Transcript_6442/g.29054  ORF Transcript_6442/g.29054 Transcript_6442/m.29054 type:complete len:217 (-) Transcript_6442:94-744(-)